MLAEIKKKAYLLVITTFIFGGCAKFVPPTGGDKDVEPPKLLSSVPADKSINYKGQLVQLVFNELVDTKTLKQDLIITPEPASRYKVTNKGKIVELLFEEPLADSTTYTFNFEKGIKDINEQNNARNLKLVFSTGSKLDSLQISGEVRDLFSKKTVLNATVALYSITLADSIPLVNRKPSYFIKTDSVGKFDLLNIKSDDYRIVAFTDKNSNQRFDNKSELFGYSSDTVKLTANVTGINLNVYPYDTIAPKYKRLVQRETYYGLRFDEDLYKVNVQFNSKSDSLAYNFLNDEVRFYKTRDVQDSVSVKVIVQDSLLNTDSVFHKVLFRTADPKRRTIVEPLRIQVDPSSRTAIVPFEEIVFKFEFPIVLLDTTKITVKDDTIRSVKFRAYFKDNSRTSVGLQTVENITSKMVVEIGEGGFVDLNNDSSSTITVEYPVLKITDTGVLAGRVGDEKNSYIVQLITEESNKIYRTIRTASNEFTFNYVRPGSYIIRVVKDDNNNGIWDSGLFAKNTLPENIYITKKAIRLKSNFEIRDIVVPIN